MVATLLVAAGWPDLLVPVPSVARAPQDAALVVGIATYPDLPPVPYAHRDADAAWTWLTSGRGVPVARVERLKDPDPVRLRFALERLAQRANPDGTLWVFWSGHAAASASDGTHHLLAAGDEPEGTALTLEALEAVLARTRAGRVVLVLDASFSGLGRDGSELVAGRRYVAAPPAAPADPRVITWRAAGPRQIAAPLEAARHGLFSWFALAALRGWADGALGPADGQVTLEEAQVWVRDRLDALPVDQTPSIDPRAIVRGEVLATVGRGPLPPLEGLATGPFPSATPERADADDDTLEALEELDAAEAEWREQFQAKADVAWARAYRSAIMGSPDAEERLRGFLGRFAGVSFLLGDREIVVSAHQVPQAHRLLASGGRRVDPLIDALPVPAGTTTIGSPSGTPGRSPDETLTRVRRTRALLASATEVSRDLWIDVTGFDPTGGIDPHAPATGVSWRQALAFCNALSALDGFTPAYAFDGKRVTWDPDADGWRLPTEAEWTALTDGRTWPGSDQPDRLCDRDNVADASLGDEAPMGPLGRFTCTDRMKGPVDVRRLPADPRGFQGLAGNVAEWVWDAWSPLPGEDQIDFAPDRPPAWRVVKGGSYATAPHATRTAHRRRMGADDRAEDVGLRVVRNAPE